MNDLNKKQVTATETPEGADQYSVAGILVHTKPENREQVALSLNQMCGVEVHLINPDGKMVVTVEELEGEKFIIDRITQINNTEGVINAALVFSQSELSDVPVDQDSCPVSSVNVEEPL